jgi:hypothetical protein
MHALMLLLLPLILLLLPLMLPLSSERARLVVLAATRRPT